MQKIKENYVSLMGFSNSLALTVKSLDKNKQSKQAIRYSNNSGRNSNGSKNIRNSKRSSIQNKSSISKSNQNINNFGLCCQKFKHKDTQLWQIQYAYEDKSNKTNNNNINQINKYFYIQSKSQQQSYYLFYSFSSLSLTISSMDLTLFSFLWSFQQIDQNNKNFGFSQIKSVNSNLVLQIQMNNLQGKQIIQMKQHERGTQKWIIEKLFDYYVIRNLCSGLVISVEQEDEDKKDNSNNINPNNSNGNNIIHIQQQLKQSFNKINPFLLHNSSPHLKKIIQQPFTNSIYQKWNMIKIKQNEFYFQSIQDSQKFIGIFNNKQRDYVYLLSHQYFGIQMKNILWKVTGALPDALGKGKFLDVVKIQKKQKSKQN